MPSSIPAARANLYTALSALTAAGQDLEGWQVTFGPPEVHTEERKVVALLGVESISTEHATIGDGGQEESYSINMAAKSHNATCNGDPAELQALDADIWSAYEAVRQAVKSDETLGGVVNIAAIVSTAGEGESDVSPVPAFTTSGSAWGWWAFLSFKVLVRTRIT